MIEALEGRTLLSASNIALDIVTADAIPVSSSPAKRYRVSPLVGTTSADAVGDNGIPTIDANSQTYFLLRKRLTDPTPVITQNAVAFNWASDMKSVDLAATASYAGVGGDGALTYTWSAIAAPPGASPVFSNNGNFVAHLTHVTFDRAGTYTFMVSITDGKYSVTDNVNVTVSPQVSNLTVTPGSLQLALGTTQQFTATALDQFGRPTNVPVSWSKDGVGVIDGTGKYQSGMTSGDSVVHALAGTQDVDTTVSVANGVPILVTPASGPATVTGQTAGLSVLGGYGGGEANLTYTWSMVSIPAGVAPTFSANGTNGAKNTTATFYTPGNYSFLVTISDGTHWTTSSVNLTVVQTLTSISVTTPSASVSAGQSLALVATGYDQFGVALATQPAYAWSKQTGVGSISGTGVFGAGAVAGNATIAASSGGVTGAVMLTVAANGAPWVVNAASAGATTVVGSGTTLSILGNDDGGEGNLIYGWNAITAPAGAVLVFSNNGNNSAKNTAVTFNKAGTYTLRAMISDGALTTTSDVVIVVAQTLVAISVTPGSSTLLLNGTQIFGAQGYDQFGAPVTMTYTWGKTSGVGSISSGGVFSAGGTAGSAVITASYGGISSAATINVGNGAPSVASAAAAGTTNVLAFGTTLSVLGADDGGEANLTYSWSVAGGPNGSNPTFTVNGNNAAKNSTVTFDKAGSYTLRATISDGTSVVTSDVVVVVSQTLAWINVTPGTSNLVINGAQGFTASALDQFGSAMAAAFTWSKVSGVGAISSSGVFSSGTSGSAVIRATVGGINGTATISVGNAAPTVATPAASNVSTVYGPVVLLSVLGADDGGEANLTYSWSLVSGPAGAAPVFSVNGTNAAKTSIVTFNKAGSYTFMVTISDGSLTTSSSATLSVAQVLTTVGVTPGTATVGIGASQVFTATGYDQFGAALVTQPGFTWSMVSGVGAINSSGVYSSGAGGSAVVRASSLSLGGNASVTVSNAAPTVVNPPTASGQTNTTVNLSVLGNDDGGAANLSYYWSLTASPVGSTTSFSASGTNAAKNATATFNRAGSYTFLSTISDGVNLTYSTVSITVSQVATTVTVTPGGVALAGNGAYQFSAAVTDQFGQAMTGAPVTWSVDAGGPGSVSSTGYFTATNNNGTATVRATSGSVSGVGGAQVTATNAAPTVVTPATASGQTATTVNLSILGNDDGGAANLLYYWSLTASPAGSTTSFSASGTNAAKNATATFNRAGSYTFLATISDGVNLTYSTVSITVAQVAATVTVTPGGVALSGGQSYQFSAAVKDQFGVAISGAAVTWSVDAGGPGSVNSTGYFTSTNSNGTATVRATSGSVSGVGGAQVTATNAAPTVVTPATASGQTATTVNLSILGNDDGGAANLLYYWSLTASPAGSTTSFSASGTNAAKSATATFNRTGSYTFLATISDGVNLTYSSVSISVAQVATTVTVSPGGVSLTGGQSYQFSAAVKDQFGVAISGAAISWSVDAGGPGSVNSAGLFTASNTTGTATVRATSGSATGVGGAAVTAVAVNNPPTIVTPANIASQSGTTVNLNILGADDGGEANLSYYWNLTASPSGSNTTISASGNNAAKNTTATFNRAGNYTFLATISDGVNLTYSAVTVTVAQVATSVTVTPGGVALSGGQSYQFSAAALDQFGQPLSATVIWSVDAGGPGSINSSGLFVATNTTGTATIRATCGGASGVAGAAVTAVTGNVVSVQTRAESSFTELLITGSSGNDTINVTQSGNTFTIRANGATQSVTGVFGDLMIKAGSGGSNITVDSSVQINAIVYGGAGNDVIANRGSGSYTAIVTIGGGVDTLYGNNVQTNYWADSSDSVNASSTETANGHVTVIPAFYQPWSTDPSNPGYVSMSLAGQDLLDPTDSSGPVHYPNHSLWGTGPSTTDIHQNAIGDCFLLSDLESMAGANVPRLEEVAVDLGDGTYAVRFKHIFTTSVVRVDGDFGAQQNLLGPSGNLWATVIEKAYAFYRLGQNSYGSLWSGWMTNVSWDLGWTVGGGTMPTTALQMAQMIDSANSSHQGLTVGTGSQIALNAALIGSHAYTLFAYSVQNGVYTFYLRNPWGYDGASDGSDPSDGVVGVTWAQMAANFQEIVASS